MINIAMKQIPTQYGSLTHIMQEHIPFPLQQHV